MTTDLATSHDGMAGIWCDEEDVTVCWGPVSVLMSHENFEAFADAVTKAAGALKSSHAVSIAIDPPLKLM